MKRLIGTCYETSCNSLPKRMHVLAFISRLFLNSIAALAALIVVYVMQSALAHSLIRPDVADFRVVYCGERAAIRDHVDPYQVEPLRTCEHRVQLETNEPAWSVTPFPLPSYATATLSPFAFLPYRVARDAWIALLVVAFALAVVAVATILDTSAFAVGLVFAPTLGILNLHYGEPVLISVAALCVAALAVHRRHATLAAIAVAVSLIEPHVGLPASLGLFLFVPKARRTLTIAIGVAAFTGLLISGIGSNLEYVRDFLPAQARAELLADDQFSLSRLLYVLGADPKLALLLGSLSYALMTAFGLWTARLLVLRSFTPGLFVLMPVAMAMLGGPFIHDVQVAAAVPAALLLARRSWTARVAVALLALDWSAPFGHRIVPALAAATGTSFVVLKTSAKRWRVIYAVSALCAVLALGFVLPRKHTSLVTTQTSLPTISATDLSSVPWGWRIKLTPSWSATGRDTAVDKLPIWTGLLLLPLSLLVLQRRFVNA